MKRTILLLSIFLILTVNAFGQDDTHLLLQKPTVNRTHIAFAYAGDLWMASRDGGEAWRLTNGIGIESDPIFSPDGKTIAFTGQYDGNVDVYIVPAAGGVPKRLTYHPAPDQAVGWTGDGKRVLFRSTCKSTSGYFRLFTVSVDGGLPEEIPLPLAFEGSYSPDGSHLAYQPLSRWQPDWKHYKGGQTAPIWIAKLSDSTIEKVPRVNSNDFDPMWIGGKVYFLSDRGGPVSLYSYDTGSKQIEQAIPNDGLDFKSASAGPDCIVYEQLGAIFLYDLKSGQSKKVDIRVHADLAGVRPHFEKAGYRISDVGISPTGARAVFEARGEIITVPAEKGDARNITNTPGVMERDPAWSPDGKWIAYFSDESGEYALHLRDQSGMGEVKKINLGNPPSFFYSPTWSPDSKRIAYYDKRLILWYVDLDKGTPVRVDKNPDGLRGDVMEPFWSPDSRWVGYTKQVDNHLRAVFVYSIENGQIHQLTDGMSDARYGAFDKSGKYLYFTASTNLGPAFSFAEMSNFPFQSSRSVYAIVLRNDQPSPLAPESDEEKIQDQAEPEGPSADKGAADKSAGDKGAADKPSGDKASEKPGASDAGQDKAAGQTGKGDAKGPGAASAKKEPEPVRIDFDGIDQRIIALPTPSLNFVGLQAGKANTIFLIELPAAGAGANGPPTLTVHKYDLEKRKFDKVLDGVNGFMVSFNGEKMLFRQGPGFFIGSTTAPIKPGEGMLKLAEMEVYVDPKAEWRQMYNEIWRGERDFLYDPGTHGLNIEQTKKLYEPYLENVAHREDLNYLFREMLNQITIGHMFIFGGDQPRPDFVSGGLLGCDFKVENGRYRFAKIYGGENWNPELRSPLTEPGVNVKEGEYLLAVNGRELHGSDNVYAFFEATAGKQVRIKVGPNADGSNSREVTVVPIGGETALRNRNWVENNRRKVDQLSGGQLAYVYVPDTSGPGYTSFNRYFFAQNQKHGAVIDERFNQGGALADYIVEYLKRPLLNYIAFRDGRDIPTPLGAIYGPKAMLINELSGSGGDALPWYFHKLQIGPLIGKRTWGGLVAAFPLPQLMDGGFVTAPDAAVYGLKGDWEVENHGVAPDIEVEFDPAAWRQGHDPQLERAVEALLDQLKSNPQEAHKRPPYPNYHQTSAGKK
jgi:tricorn protease